MKKTVLATVNHFITNKYITNIFMALILVSGIACLQRLNAQFFPSIKNNLITIVTEWPGANAKQVEEKITYPIESTIQNLEEVQSFSSTSHDNFSFIKVKIPWNQPMQGALDTIKNAINSIKNLPEDSEPSVVKEGKLTELVGIIVIGGQDIESLRHLITHVRDTLVQKNIGTVIVTGLPTQELTIRIDKAVIHRLHMSLPQILQTIKQSDKDIPIGQIKGQAIEQNIGIVNPLKEIRELKNLLIKTPDSQTTVRLGDISNIHLNRKTDNVNLYKNNKPYVTIALRRSGDINIVDSAKHLRSVFKQLKQQTNPEIKMSLMYVYSDQVTNSISLLLENAITGLILIMLFIYLALNIRISIWIATGVVLSIFGGIIFLYLAGGSLNIISLTAFIIGSGIIVDDVVVISDEFTNNLQKNMSVLTAIQQATTKMLIPIFSSSITTIAAFLPLIIVGGVIGQALRAIPLVVCSVVVASLIECFLIFPHHLYKSHLDVKVSKKPSYKRKLNYYARIFQQRYFKKAVVTVLHYRGAFITFIVTFFILSCSMITSGRVGFTFFSSPVYNRFAIGIDFKPGISYEKRQHYLHSIELAALRVDKQLAKNGLSLLKNYYFVMNKTMNEIEQKDIGLGSDHAHINFELVESQHRDVGLYTFIDTLLNEMDYPAYVQDANISTYDIGPPGKDINLTITGNTKQTLKTVSDKIKQQLNSYPGVYNIKDDMPYGRERIVLKLTNLGRRLGLTEQNVAEQLQAAFHGVEVKSFYKHLDEIQVRLALNKNQKNYISELENFPISTPKFKVILLSQIATYHVERLFSKINHHEGALSMTITAKIRPKQNNIANVLRELNKHLLPSLQNRYHININYGGRVEEQRATFDDMILGLSLALIIIYGILVLVFSSYSLPLVVMLALPLTIIGVIWGHYFLGFDISVMSIFGLFGLIGISVNDAIVLVGHYLELRRKHMATKQAIIQSCCRRLRPVLLTSVTTIVGLLPLLMSRSEDAKLLIPVAISISFGLAFSTILSLLIVPCALYIHEHIFYKQRLG